MSRVRIAIRPRAVNDLDEIQEYFVARDVEVADRFADAAAADFDRLAEMPGLGAPRSVRNPRLRGLRSWPVKGFRNYLIFYLTTPDQIEIVRVFMERGT